MTPMLMDRSSPPILATDSAFFSPRPIESARQWAISKRTSGPSGYLPLVITVCLCNPDCYSRAGPRSLNHLDPLDKPLDARRNQCRVTQHNPMTRIDFIAFISTEPMFEPQR
jgi:hypothetical protein